MNEIALLLILSACVCYGIWQETKIEVWQARVRWRNEIIDEQEAIIADLKKRNESLSFALYGKQEMAKMEGDTHA